MMGVGTLKRGAKSCLRRLGLRKPPPPVPPEQIELTPFVCNVCGAANCLPKSRLGREDGRCVKCDCYARLRSMMYAVTAQFSPDEIILAAMKPRKDIRGVGCSDWGYVGLLEEKFDYINTFYDEAPRLDLCNIDWSLWPPESVDFITCTDVLEHVAPPIETAFANMYRLLKPGGVSIITVPTTLDPATREHFPDLHDWRIEVTEDKKRVLIDRRRDGTLRQYDDLCFHGGVGLTLEFRCFSRQGLIDAVQRAGFRAAKIHDHAIEPYGFTLERGNFILVAEKPSGRTNPARDEPFSDPFQLLFDCQHEIATRCLAPGSNSQGYAERYRREEFGYWTHIPRWLRDDFGKAADGRKLRCLDVGCAYGTLLLYAIKSLGCEPYAVDFIRYLDQSLIDDYGIQYRINNIEREAFPWPVRFDVILFTEVLEHLNFHALPTLKKLRDLLAPGGRLYLTTPDASQWGRQTKYYADYSQLPMPSADDERPPIDDHVWQFSEGELRELVATSGFRIMRFDYAAGPGKRHFNLALQALS
jgi:2-polyprenyl-3-methyl-5-hydroxy-6-metoxy-1,4-benzoquinol methylase